MTKSLLRRLSIPGETEWIIAIAIVSGLVTASFSMDTFRTTARLTSLHQTAERTGAAIGMLDRLRFELTEAENALRGYALTRDTADLALCDSDLARIRQDETLLPLPEAQDAGGGEQVGMDLRIQLDSWLKQFTASRNLLAAGPKTGGIALPAVDVVTHLNEARAQAQTRLAGENGALTQSEQRADRRGMLSIAIAILCILCAFSGAVIEGRARRRMTRSLHAERLGAIAANRTKSSFLAYTSHELRTPLNAIIGFSEFMMMGYAGTLTERQKQYLGDIRSSGMHLQALIGDILDLTKAEAGKITLAEEVLEIDALVSTCLKLTEGHAKDAGVTLRTLLPDGLPRLRGDGLRCKQILLNITNNAIQFTPQGGVVTIEARTVAEGLELVVSDTGRGIDAQDLPKIMEPYFQAGIEEPSHKGYGLGLPLARRIAELHGGTLSLTSQKGKGTVVRVFFPSSRCIAEGSLPAASREAEVVLLVPRAARG